MDKNEIKVGDKGYTRQFTGSMMVDMVKRPYTVISVSKSKVLIQACELIYPEFHYNPETMSEYYKQFDGRRVSFYNTVAEEIIPNANGHILELTWHPKKGLWGTSESYPEYFIVGGYQHQPYLD